MSVIYKRGTISDWGIVNERKSEDEDDDPHGHILTVIPPGTSRKLTPVIIYLNTHAKIRLDKLAELLDVEFKPARDEIYERNRSAKFIQGWIYGMVNSGEYTWIITELTKTRFWEKRLAPLPLYRKIINLDRNIRRT